MKQASVSILKNNLSTYLDLVREGEVILVTDRGRPVARLAPLEVSTDESTEARRLELERRGILERAEVTLDMTVLEGLPPLPQVDGDAVAALLREREEDR